MKTSDGGLIVDKICTGKPNPNILNIIRNEHNIPLDDLSKIIMIGDNPETDIALGNNCGIDSCLVFTGVCKDYIEAENWEKRS